MGVKKNKDKKFDFRDILIVFLFLFISFICVGLFWYDLMQTLNLQNVDPVGTVVVRKNTVQRRFSSRVLWDRLAKESPVYVGDLIRIADVSAATLYIGGSSIELEENTLIRILLSPDGESIVIEVSSGEVSIVPTEESRNIFVSVGGNQTQAIPGRVLTASVEGTGGQVQRNEVSEWLENTGRLASMTGTKLKLMSPAVNSIIRYQDTPPVVNFQWEEIENAVFYEIEIFMMPVFDFPYIRESYITAFMTETRLREGTWYWRVRPVYSSVYNVETVFSDISFFRILKEESANNEQNLSDWLALESPLRNDLPPNLPQELIPAHFAATPAPQPPSLPAPPPPLAVRPPSPAPLPRFPAPRNMLPETGAVFGIEELRSQEKIEFSWSPVPQATAYILTLYHESSSGRRQILRTNPIARTNYTLTNLRVLDRATFVWQVEAVSTGRGGAIERHGTPGESVFALDFPLPSPVQIDDTGILYGN